MWFNLSVLTCLDLWMYRAVKMCCVIIQEVVQVEGECGVMSNELENQELMNEKMLKT